MTIYLDCNATTPMDPEVAKVVRHYMEVEFGNAGSRTHEFGLRAKQAVERAREQVAAVVAAKPDEVIFTSGATEANNLAILGLEAEGRRTGKMHIVSTQIEHKAVLEPLEEMERRGFEVTLAPPERDGRVDAARIAGVLRPDTLLVSVMHVNNETGVIQDVRGVVAALDQHEAYLHVDAAQGYGKVAGLESERVDLISVSAHKIYGPKGVGALIARRRKWTRPPLQPLFFGGGQEHGLRPGTLPVALVAGFGVASTIASSVYAECATEPATPFRIALIEGIQALGLEPLGDPELAVATTLAIDLGEVDSEAAILALKTVAAVSNGAACGSASYKESYVYQAMGRSGRGLLRLSWDRPLEAALATRVVDALRRVRSADGAIGRSAYLP